MWGKDDKGDVLYLDNIMRQVELSLHLRVVLEEHPVESLS